MNRIILATKNPHKTRELSALLGGLIRLEDLNSIGYQGDIVEDGNSFIENALIKCKAIYQMTQLPVLADDSGLCVDHLGGRPGIHSARYGGEGLTDIQRYQLLLEEMSGVEKRDAAFVCALVLYLSPTRCYIVQEECRGSLLTKPSGANGFGYDPIFFTPVYGTSLAEVSDEEKHKISHRGKAARSMATIIRELS